MNSRQMQLLEALKEAGCTSPVSRQEIVDACAASGAYACPPSWLTQDSARKVGRGLYDCPELATMSGSVPSLLLLQNPLLLLPLWLVRLRR